MSKSTLLTAKFHSPQHPSRTVSANSINSVHIPRAARGGRILAEIRIAESAAELGRPEGARGRRASGRSIDQPPAE